MPGNCFRNCFRNCFPKLLLGKTGNKEGRVVCHSRKPENREIKNANQNYGSKYKRALLVELLDGSKARGGGGLRQGLFSMISLYQCLIKCI